MLAQDAGLGLGMDQRDGMMRLCSSHDEVMLRLTVTRSHVHRILRKTPKYRYFKEKFDEAANLLPNNNHEMRVKGASIIVQLVEDGAGVIGPSLRTEWQGRAHYDTE